MKVFAAVKKLNEYCEKMNAQLMLDGNGRIKGFKKEGGYDPKKMKRKRKRR
jgi:hypothetical protein|tara:strand:- start:1269 stop:1421 length:153 start_codon:yes stop_codon:yes gene_type:complete